MKYPPCGQLLAVLVSSQEEEKAEQLSGKLAALTADLTEEGLELLGPTKAGISRIKDIYRYVLYYKESARGDLITEAKQRMERYLLKDDGQEKGDCIVQFDFNPMINY